MRLPIFLLSLTLAAQPRPVNPPALPQSGMPFFATAPNGDVFLSWIDYLPENEHALRFAKWTGSKWTAPETIAQGAKWFVNWADFPSLAVLPDGSMLAHWLTRSAAANKYGYGIRVAKRDPATAKWRQVHGISLDEATDYAGFLHFIPGASGAIYLAPPQQPVEHSHDDHDGHRKTVRFLALRPDGSVESDRELDPDACSCCQTAVGRTPTGLVAAYRDHLPGEIRDISIVRFKDGAWTQPKTLHPDGWRINACPTDGPVIATRERNVAITWLTRANAQPKVQLSLSPDEGGNFAPPLRIDSGNPIGRPTVIPFDAFSYLLLWLERTNETTAEIRLRRATTAGRLLKPMTIATVPAGRGVGFPKVALSGDNILLAWRDESVRAAIITKQNLKEFEK